MNGVHNGICHLHASLFGQDENGKSIWGGLIMISQLVVSLKVAALPITFGLILHTSEKVSKPKTCHSGSDKRCHYTSWNGVILKENLQYHVHFYIKTEFSPSAHKAEPVIHHSKD